MQHDGSLEYFSKGEGRGLVALFSQLLRSNITNMYQKQQDSRTQDSFYMPSYRQLKIVKFRNTVVIYDPWTLKYEKLRDLGNTEILTGNTPVLGEFFQRLGGSRRGLMDYNMDGAQLPGSVKAPSA